MTAGTGHKQEPEENGSHNDNEPILHGFQYCATASCLQLWAGAASSVRRGVLRGLRSYGWLSPALGYGSRASEFPPSRGPRSIPACLILLLIGISGGELGYAYLVPLPDHQNLRLLRCEVFHHSLQRTMVRTLPTAISERAQGVPTQRVFCTDYSTSSRAGVTHSDRFHGRGCLPGVHFDIGVGSRLSCSRAFEDRLCLATIRNCNLSRFLEME